MASTVSLPGGLGVKVANYRAGRSQTQVVWHTLKLNQSSKVKVVLPFKLGKEQVSCCGQKTLKRQYPAESRDCCGQGMGESKTETQRHWLGGAPDQKV